MMKTNWVQKNIGKRIWGQKILKWEEKKYVRKYCKKIFCLKKIVSEKIFDQKNSVKKKFGTKKILVPKNGGPKNISTEKCKVQKM